LVSTQAELQASNPASHTLPQVPAAQVAVPCGGTGQALLQLPQWLAELAKFEQAPAQFCRFFAHWLEHFPAEQTRPGSHAVEHAPQFSGSDCVSTHCPWQAVDPEPHVVLH